MRDITERKQAEEMSAKLEDQLHQAQKMESIGRLAGGIAHDFNNLLTVIHGYCDIIQDQLAIADPLLVELKQIQQASERAAALTRQLLAFSRKQILAPTVLDLNSLVTNLRAMLARLIGEDITLDTVLGVGLRPITADPSQIEQVIMNLAGNARGTDWAFYPEAVRVPRRGGSHMRVVDGQIEKGDKIRLMAAGRTYQVSDVGVFAPKISSRPELSTGEVGFMFANIKTIHDVNIGETVTGENHPCDAPLPGYKPPQQMVFCDFYPSGKTQYEELRDAMLGFSGREYTRVDARAVEFAAQGERTPITRHAHFGVHRLQTVRGLRSHAAFDQQSIAFDLQLQQVARHAGHVGQQRDAGVVFVHVHRRQHRGRIRLHRYRRQAATQPKARRSRHDRRSVQRCLGHGSGQQRDRAHCRAQGPGPEFAHVRDPAQA
jgi:hypothetical protein